jgi:hypothetical protein
MSTMEAEVFDAFSAMGVPDEKASAAAQALSKRDQTLEMTTMKGDIATLKSDVSSLKVDVNSLKADNLLIKWILGFVGPGVLSLVIMAFGHLRGLSLPSADALHKRHELSLTMENGKRDLEQDPLTRGPSSPVVGLKTCLQC